MPEDRLDREHDTTVAMIDALAPFGVSHEGYSVDDGVVYFERGGHHYAIVLRAIDEPAVVSSAMHIVIAAHQKDHAGDPACRFCQVELS